MNRSGEMVREEGKTLQKGLNQTEKAASMNILIFQRRKIKVGSVKEERAFPTYSVNDPPSHTLFPLLTNSLFEISISSNLIGGISILTKSRK